MRLEAYLQSNAYRNILLKIAHQKLSRCNAPSIDADDLLQIALTEVWTRREQYDASRASCKTFAHRYGEWAMAMELRRRASVTERINDHAFSLSTTGGDDADAAPAYLSPAVDSRDVQDMRLAMAEAMALLTDRQRELCARLAHMTPAEIAQADKVSRNTIYCRLRDIRAVFEHHGISL